MEEPTVNSTDPVLAILMKKQNEGAGQQTQEDGQVPDADNALDAAAQELLGAIRKGDPAGVADALSTAVEAVLAAHNSQR